MAEVLAPIRHVRPDVLRPLANFMRGGQQLRGHVRRPTTVDRRIRTHHQLIASASRCSVTRLDVAGRRAP